MRIKRLVVLSGLAAAAGGLALWRRSKKPNTKKDQDQMVVDLSSNGATEDQWTREESKASL